MAHKCPGRGSWLSVQSARSFRSATLDRAGKKRAAPAYPRRAQPLHITVFLVFFIARERDLRLDFCGAACSPRVGGPVAQHCPAPLVTVWPPQHALCRTRKKIRAAAERPGLAVDQAAVDQNSSQNHRDVGQMGAYLSAPVKEKVSAWLSLCAASTWRPLGCGRLWAAGWKVRGGGRTPAAWPAPSRSPPAWRLPPVQECDEGANETYEYGACAMQGWRTDMVRAPPLPAASASAPPCRHCCSPARRPRTSLRAGGRAHGGAERP